MNRKLLFFLAFFVLALLYFFLRFGGPEDFVTWYKSFSNDNTWLPNNPYNNRIVGASKLSQLDATRVIFEDQSLFWHGHGASASAKLNEAGELEQLEIASAGSGYGEMVTARVVGAGANQFELGDVTVKNGGIVAIQILKTAKWYKSPHIFFEGESLPYSGTAEIKHRNGQLFERRQYLSGELHGKWEKWKSNGIPVFEKEFLHGLKHGTHMFWHGNPIDPKDYKTNKEASSDPDEEKYPSLWVEINQKVQDEFKGKKGSQQERNDWMINTYKEKGGSFSPALLEHFENNKRHGLFEKYDDTGNKILKDEYETGKLIKHKAFDPGGS
jgi:antitoxin component YwqK of YwqJK toxin-antitoxin module